MRYSIGEHGCGHILMGGNSGGKEGNDKGIRKGRRRKREKVWDMYKTSSHTGGNTNKKILFSHRLY